MSVKLKNCIILTGLNNENDVLKDCVLCIDQKNISYIGPDENAPICEKEKDMGGKLLMPGLVNSHCHGPMTLLRGIGCGLKLQDWLNTAIFPIEERLTPDDIEAGERWAVAEMLAGGITCVSEMYDFPERMGKVLSESGMKGNISRVGLSFSETEEIPPGRFEECIGLVENWKDPDDRVIAEFCLHSEYLTNERFVRQIAEANQSLKKNVNIHVSETQKEHEECKARHGGLTPVKYLEKCGLLDQKTYMAHCVWVEDEDIAVMAKKGSSAVFNPSSNCKLASGFAPIEKMKHAGVNVAIGTDGVASNDNLNIVEEMHLASMLIKNSTGDATAACSGDIIRMATLNGAAAMGRNDTGVLAEGMRADIIAVSLDRPHMYPAFDHKNLLVYSAQASDVSMTMVDGRILYENGEYFTIDMEKNRADFKSSVKRIYG